jgi:hypothetical protein
MRSRLRNVQLMREFCGQKKHSFRGKSVQLLGYRLAWVSVNCAELCFSYSLAVLGSLSSAVLAHKSSLVVASNVGIYIFWKLTSVISDSACPRERPWTTPID